MSSPSLYIFSGLPGTGKTTLAKILVKKLNAVYLRVDTIEQTLKDCGQTDFYDAGYCVAKQLAIENLQLGNPVVADSANTVPESSALWHQAARIADVIYVDIYLTCSDIYEHKHRIENRSTDIKNLILPTWEHVQQRVFQDWKSEVVCIDTSGDRPDGSFNKLWNQLSIRDT